MSLKNKTLQYKSFIKKNERLLMPTFLILGFIVDWFTLNRVDQVFDNLVLLVYIVLAGISILFSHSKIYRPGLIQKLKDGSPLLMQYAFGGLFSGLMIFYFRSSHFITSLPFLLILLILFLGNDLLHRKYQKLIFQVSIFYIAIFSYSNLITPIILSRINLWTFLLAGVVSLILIHLFIVLLQRIRIEEIVTSRIYKYVGGILTIFIILYFTNIIPPIPLSLKESHIAHNINKVSSDNNISYYLTLEDNPWYIFWSKYTDNVHIEDNSSVYVFTKIFAPTNFKSTIYHEWSYFDEEANRWIRTDRIPINISGGSDEGFRGYSVKTNLMKGTWRVDIETESAQIIGRTIFEIKEIKEEISLTKVLK